MIFWATQHDGSEFYREAVHNYYDIISVYSNKIRHSMNVLVRRILLSGFYRNVQHRGIIPQSFRDIHYPSFDFTDLYLSESPDFPMCTSLMTLKCVVLVLLEFVEAYSFQLLLLFNCKKIICLCCNCSSNVFVYAVFVVVIVTYCKLLLIGRLKKMMPVKENTEQWQKKYSDHFIGSLHESIQNYHCYG